MAALQTLQQCWNCSPGAASLPTAPFESSFSRRKTAVPLNEYRGPGLWDVVDRLVTF